MVIHKLIAVTLIFTQGLPVQTGSPSLKGIALGTPIGSITEVRLAGKEKPNKLRGRIGMVDNQAVEIQILGEGRSETRRVAFADIKTIRVIKIMRTAPVRTGTTAREQATAIPRGALVEVQLGPGQKPNRIRGRIGHVVDQEIELQVLQDGNIRDKTFRFDELQSISMVDSLEITSKPEKVHRAIGFGLGITLAVVGVLLLIGGILIATQSGG